METQNVTWADVDEQGRLVLPPDVAREHGLLPGTRVRIENGARDIRVHRPATHLAKVYIEPTSLCNLACRTCIRNNWEEPAGKMSAVVFERIVDGLYAMQDKPAVFFGGLGEPLYHPRIIEMVQQAKATGARVELITNGTLLSETRARKLIAAGLDMLWVSIDGASPESYSDVRLGAKLPQVLANLDRFRKLRRGSHQPRPQIGVAFVCMQRNINDLPKVIKLGLGLGATRFSITNVLPYTEDMQAEVLYKRSLRNITYLPSPWLPQLSLPKMDINEITREAFFQALNSNVNVTLAGSNLGGANDVCSFVETGSMAIGWDGSVSPCLSLLHTHTSYLHCKPRYNRRHVIGSVADRDLGALWLDPDFIAYREKVQGFGFAPCTFCGGCDLSESNEEDCLGNTFPTCGGCLWAQGMIHCP